MRRGRWIGLAVAVSMLAGSVVLALARPPATDPDRLARIDTMYDGFRGLFQGVPDVEASEAKAMLDRDDVVLVDVREPQERAVSMIPGAIPAEDYEARAQDYADKVVVAYCTIGYRSGLWAKKQRANGVDARNLKGSLLAWTHADGPLVRDGQPTRAVHVYGARWNLAASDYEATW